MKFNKEKTSGTFGRDICLSGLAGLLFELINIDENTLVNDSSLNVRSVNFLLAKNESSLAIYVKQLKNLYVFKKDNEGCWEEDYFEKNTHYEKLILSGNKIITNFLK